MKTPPPSCPLPTIHANGTGAQTLYNGYQDARHRLLEAIRAFEAVEFNARDYYPQSPEAWTDARAERVAMAQKLGDVETYLIAHLVHIGDAMA